MVAAIVVRNSTGNLLYLASKLNPCSSPHLAETLALNWASSYAFHCGWTNVIWECDTKEVVKEVLDDAEPIGWESRYAVLDI